MRGKFVSAALALFCLTDVLAATNTHRIRDDTKISYVEVCKKINSTISSASAVFFPSNTSGNYADDIAHYSLSSSQQATCSVEPATTEDVGAILQLLGLHRTPFAVKGGGHAMNPNFSSTPGVQIAMTRFSEVTFNAEAQTAEVGAGLVWDDIYAALAPFNVSVVGGRVSGIGAAGFTLGGGLSWKTNQFGLAIDNVEAFELVLPNGTVASVSEASNEKLFFGLKGGWNNFGIVTKFILKTVPQGLVWGGIISFDNTTLDAFGAALVKFSSELTDPKAAAIGSYTAAFGQTSTEILLFYDAPTPPEGIFDDFLAIPATSSNISTRSLLSLVQASPIQETTGLRGFYQDVSLTQISRSVTDAVINELQIVTESLPTVSNLIASYALEPFLPTMFAHGPPSAWPPSRDVALLPVNLWFAWTNTSDDTVMHSAIKASSARLTQAVLADGQNIANASLYGNYAVFGTPLHRILGQNIANLTVLQRQYDPDGIMALAGGWKF